MSFLGETGKYVGYLGRGLEDLFTLGSMEAARNNGGNFGNKFFNVLDKGFGSNFMAGAAGGSAIVGSGMGGGGAAAGSGSGMGGGAMASYMPTSTPVMGQAGSTLGGGMGSAMNLTPSAMGSTGAAPGAAVAGASPMSQALNYMRMMPQGGGQGQAQSGAQSDILQRIYKMYPNLIPGSGYGGWPNGMGS